jgi:hypothetical protein
MRAVRPTACLFPMPNDNFNSLGHALAMAGVCSQAAAARRPAAAWMTRPPTPLERFHAALFNAEARVAHKTGQRAHAWKRSAKAEKTTYGRKLILG